LPCPSSPASTAASPSPSAAIHPANIIHGSLQLAFAEVP
jgi:hypothetical protein